MAIKRRMPKYGGQTGMWSTITAAVQAGWGPTGRLVSVLAVLGMVLIGVTAAAGDSAPAVLLRALLAGSR